MSTALLAYQSITLSKDIYKGVKNKPIMFDKTHIMSVSDAAQNKLLKNVEDFVKRKVLTDLKRKASFTLTRMLVLAKYIMILGVIGIIGMYIGKFIYKFIKWCEEIEKKYNVIDNLSKMFDEWKKSGGNIFVFIHQNWSEKFNLKEKLLTIITDGGEWLWNKSIEWINSAWNFIKKTYDDVIGWFNNDILDETTGFNLNTDDYFDDSQIEIRSPYDLNKTYNLNDPEVVEATKKNTVIKNDNIITGEVDDSEVASKEEDPPLKSDMKTIPSDKSALWSAKDKIKSISTEVGAGDIFNKSLGKGSEKSVEDANKIIKGNQQNEKINESIKVLKRENNHISSGFSLQFDNTQMLKDIQTLKLLKENLITKFKYDELILQTLQFTLESK